jgi:hypothetical protein
MILFRVQAMGFKMAAIYILFFAICSEIPPGFLMDKKTLYQLI